MAIGIVTIDIKDAGGTTRTARFVSSDASVAGLLMPGHTLLDQAEAEILGRVAASPTQHTIGDRLRKGARMFVAQATQLTRPANTTAYTAGDSISNTATAGSVTAMSATVSADNDEPVALDKITIETTDTGLGGKSIAVHVFNADPTASTGVVGGDNAAWSNKRNGYLGRFEGTFRTFSDGAMATLTPSEGSSLICTPSSGAKLLYVQFQTLSDFTPSANSTTLQATLRGRQGVS